MEWVETTAKSIAEAKELALDKLGVDDSEIELEILEEPKQGLFGRVRGEARVRARIAPKTPRDKDDRRDRKRRPKGKPAGAKSGDNRPTKETDGDTPAPAASAGKPGGGRERDDGDRRPKRDNRNEGRSNGARKARPDVEDSPIEDVVAGVEGFLAGLTTAFGIETTISSEIDGEHLMTSIEGKHGILLGPKARTLDAIQELTRATAQRATPSGTRIKVDVGGYRQARRDALAGFAVEAAERAIAEQAEIVLEPMNSADRKVVHDALTDVAGVSTRSAGNDPRRRVIVVPDVTADDEAEVAEVQSSDVADDETPPTTDNGDADSGNGDAGDDDV
jgi:spoIIIJ-associated protein